MAELPAIIHSSKEAYRMYRALCEGSTEDEEKDAKTHPRNKRAKGKVFSNNTQAFLVATAIGLVKGKRLKLGEEQAQLIRGEYLRNNKNYDAFKQLLKSKFDVKTEREIADLMVEFSECGVRELYDEYHKTGDIDFVELSKLRVGKSSGSESSELEVSS